MQAVTWPHQCSALVLVRNFPTRFFPFFGTENADLSELKCFVGNTSVSTKCLLGRIFQPNLRLMDKTWLGKDPSIASSPVVSTFPSDVDLYHVILIELAPNKAEQGFDVVFPQSLQISQPLGRLSFASRNGIFMKSEPIQQEQLCLTDWS